MSLKRVVVKATKSFGLAIWSCHDEITGKKRLLLCISASSDVGYEYILCQKPDNFCVCVLRHE